MHNYEIYSSSSTLQTAVINYNQTGGALTIAGTANLETSHLFSTLNNNPDEITTHLKVSEDFNNFLQGYSIYEERRTLIDPKTSTKLEQISDRNASLTAMYFEDRLTGEGTRAPEERIQTPASYSFDSLFNVMGEIPQIPKTKRALERLNQTLAQYNTGTTGKAEFAQQIQEILQDNENLSATQRALADIGVWEKLNNLETPQDQLTFAQAVVIVSFHGEQVGTNELFTLFHKNPEEAKDTDNQPDFVPAKDFSNVKYGGMYEDILQENLNIVGGHVQLNLHTEGEVGNRTFSIDGDRLPHTRQMRLERKDGNGTYLTRSTSTDYINEQLGKLKDFTPETKETVQGEPIQISYAGLGAGMIHSGTTELNTYSQLWETQDAVEDREITKKNRGIIESQVGMDTPGHTVFDTRIDSLDTYSQHLTERYSPTDHLVDASREKDLFKKMEEALNNDEPMPKPKPEELPTERLIQTAADYADNTAKFNQMTDNLIKTARNTEIERDDDGSYSLKPQEIFTLAVNGNVNPAKYSPIISDESRKAFEDAMDAYQKLKEDNEEITPQEAYAELNSKQRAAFDNAVNGDFNEMIHSMTEMNKPEPVWTPVEHERLYPHLKAGEEFSPKLDAAMPFFPYESVIQKLAIEELGAGTPQPLKDKRAQKLISDLIHSDTPIEDILKNQQALDEDELNQLKQAAEEARRIYAETSQKTEGQAEDFEQQARAYLKGDPKAVKEFPQTMEEKQEEMANDYLKYSKFRSH